VAKGRAGDDLNYKPDDLYPNGLRRVRFLPAIEILKRDLDVVELTVHRSPPAHHRALGLLLAHHENAMRTSRCSSSDDQGDVANRSIEVGGRPITFRRRSGA
jgi:cell division protein ZapE